MKRTQRFTRFSPLLLPLHRDMVVEGSLSALLLQLQLLDETEDRRVGHSAIRPYTRRKRHICCLSIGSIHGPFPHITCVR